jgi:peptidoglycan/xylan/chitin deacetylase (PgdA/CDA1 family)
MLTKLAIILMLSTVYFTRIVNFNILLLLLFTVYWMPKCIIIKASNYLYPQVVTHSTKLVNSEIKTIALTFDDVPYYNTENLETIVSLLDKYNMKGTFFVISNYVTSEKARNILVKMVANGHQLGNHGKRNIMHLLLPKRYLQEEIGECDHLIREIYNLAGKKVPNKMVYRPGCGAFNQRLIDIAQSYGYTVTLGSVYPNDPIMRLPLINYYYIVSHLEGNDIVITHDRDWTPRMLEMLLGYMQRNAYKSVTVNDLISN